MSGFSVTEPSRRQKWIAGLLVITYAAVTIMPLLWIIATGFKSPEDAIAYPPKVVFQPSLEGYVNLFSSRTRITENMQDTLEPPATWYDQVARDSGTIIVGPSRYGAAVPQLGSDRFWFDFPGHRVWHHRGIRLFPVQGAVQG